MKTSVLSISLFLLTIAAQTALAQRDVCWRESYPSIPGEWAGYGSVVEAGNRFQTVAGATLELWATSNSYTAQRDAPHEQRSAASLVETVVSDAHGRFAFKTLQRQIQPQPGSWEIRAHMAGREGALAYAEIGKGPPPQWFGRGIKVALSHKGQGCSRIYSAGLDDTDCGLLNCENLPVGSTRFVFPDGTLLRNARLKFYRASMIRQKHAVFSLTTGPDGLVTMPAESGCFYVDIENNGSVQLCLSGKTTTEPITVTLPPKRTDGNR